MSDKTPRNRWLLLDPPGTDGYTRRVSLREKADAPPAPYPSMDLILLSGAVRDAGYTPVFVDAQIRRWTWDDLYHAKEAAGARGIVSLLSSARMEDELPRLRRLKEVMDGIPVYAVASIHMVLDAQRCRALLREHPWLSGIILKTAENDRCPR